MNNMQWWADAVAELSDDALEQVASGIGTNRPARHQRLARDMHDMAVHELAQRSLAELAKEQ